MDWEKAVESFGTAGVIIVAVGIGARFVAREIVLPIRDRAITRLVAFCDRLDGIMDRMELRDAQVVSLLDSFKASLKRIDDRLEKVEDACERMEDRTARQAGDPSRRTAPRGPRHHPPNPSPPPAGSDG